MEGGGEGRKNNTQKQRGGGIRVMVAGTYPSRVVWGEGKASRRFDVLWGANSLRLLRLSRDLSRCVKKPTEPRPIFSWGASITPWPNGHKRETDTLGAIEGLLQAKLPVPSGPRPGERRSVPLTLSRLVLSAQLNSGKKRILFCQENKEHGGNDDGTWIRQGRRGSEGGVREMTLVALRA